MEVIEYKNITITYCEVGGEKMDTLLRLYFENSQGLIFFIDSTIGENIESARVQLHKALKYENKYKVLLILAHKQQSNGAMDLFEIQQKLQLSCFSRSNWQWKVVPLFIDANQAISQDEEEKIFYTLDWLVDYCK